MYAGKVWLGAGGCRSDCTRCSVSQTNTAFDKEHHIFYIAKCGKVATRCGTIRMSKRGNIYQHTAKSCQHAANCGKLLKRANIPFIFSKCCKYQNAANRRNVRVNAARCGGSMGGNAAIRIRCCCGSRLVAISNVMANIRAHTHC